jgi:AsmA protein
MKPGKQPAKESSIKQALLGFYGIVGVGISTFGPFKVPFAESHAKEYWRHALIGLILILLFVGGIISFAFYMFDANYFKSQMVDYVKTHHQRDLTLEGDIKVTFFPKLGLDARKMTLSQRNSNKKFASIENARLYVAWLPLVQKQLQIENVDLDGVHANIIRFKNGSSNLDDLFTVEGSHLGDITFEIDSIKIKNSSANLQDETSDIHLSLHNLNIETGKLSDSTPGTVSANFRLESAKPRIDSKVKLSSHVLFELKTDHYEFANFEGEMEGEVAGLNNLILNFQGTVNNYPAQQKLTLDKFSVTAKGKLENRRLEAKLDIPKLQMIKNDISGNSAAINTSILQDDENLTASAQLPAFTIKENKLLADNITANIDLFTSGRTLQGKLSSPLSLDLASRQLQLSAMNGNFSATHPMIKSKLSATFNGDFNYNIAEQTIQSNLKSKIDDSNIVASIGVKDFSQPAYTFDIGANSLDLDRYLVIDLAQRLQDDATPFDFSYLKTLNMRGKLRSNEFKLAKLKLKNFSTEIKNEQSVLTIEPVLAQLYGGTAVGSLSISNAEATKVTLKQKLTAVQINDLFAAISPGEAKLTGKGNFALDLTASGDNMAALRKSANGSANISLTQGTVAGMNLTDTLLANKAQLGIKNAELKEPAKFTETTPYTELKSTFNINNGIAKTDNYSIKSNTYISKGEGEITLDTGLLNYQLNTTIASNLKRSNHGELAELKGTTIPMQINGHYQTPLITLNLGMASGGNLSKLVEKNQIKNEPVVAKPSKSATVRTAK